MLLADSSQDHPDGGLIRQSTLYSTYPPVRPGQVVGDAADFTGVRVSTACRVPLDDEITTVLAYSLPHLLDFGLNIASAPGEAMIEMGVYFNYNRPPPDARKQFGYIYADFDPNQTAQYALGALWHRLDKEMDDLTDPELFAKRKQRALASAGDFGTDKDAGAAMVSGNRTVKAARAREILTALTYDELSAFITTFVTPSRAAVGITHGRDSERPQTIELAARSKHEQDTWADDALSHLSAAEIEPVLAAYTKADLRPATWFTLGNGLPFVYLELPGLDRVRLGGTRVLPPLKIQRPGDKPGIAQLYSLAVRYDDRQHRDPDEPDYRPRKLPYDLEFRLTPGKLVYSGRARLGLTGRLIRAFADQDDGFALLANLAASGPWPADLLPVVANWSAGQINELAAQVLSANRFAFTALGPLLDEDIERFGVE